MISRDASRLIWTNICEFLKSHYDIVRDVITYVFEFGTIYYVG